MRYFRSTLAGVTLFATAAGCHIDDLVDTPPTGVLVATPAAVAVTAAAGPGTPRALRLTITSATRDSVPWIIDRTGDGSWLSVDERAGSTPDTLHLTVDAAGLAAGEYVDTLRIVPDDPERATTRVPVRLTVVSGAERLAFRQVPTTTAAGSPVTPAVTVAGVDRDGAVITTFTGTVTLALAGGPAGATLSGDVSASAVNGVATFSGLSLDKAGAGYTLVASTPGMPDETSPSFAITPGAATRLAFTQQPTATTPNTSITPAVTVTALDRYDNVVTGFTAAITITLGRDGSVLGNAQLSGTRTVNAAAGVASFADLKLDQLGSGYTLVAASNGLVSATSERFDITPLSGSASEQRFSQQPSAVQEGATMSPPVEVTILDGLGAPVAGFTEPVSLTLTGGSPGAVLTGATTAIPANGVARFSSLGVDRSGTGFRLVARTRGLTDATSAPFDVAAAPTPPGALTVTSSTAGPDPDPDGYTVTVHGDARSLAPNATTTIGGLAAGTESVALTGVAGNCAVQGANPRSVTITSGDTTFTTFAVSCTALPPTTGALTVVSSTTGADLDPDGYTVRVNGEDRNLAPNASTTFTALPAGAQSVELTGIAGNCGVEGGNPRTVTITAGNTVSTTFNVSCTAVPPPPAATQLRFTAQPPSVAIVGGNFVVSVAALDAGGTLVPAYSGTVQLTLQGGLLGTSLAGTTTVPAVNGVANFTDLRVTGPCVTCRLQASAAGLSGASSDAFTVVVP